MIDKEYDVIVIGSGAAGGTVAKELVPLVADGLSVVVLEWGAKLAQSEFNGREVDMAKKLFFDSGGMLTKDRSMTLAAGRTYGGSTAIYTGTSLTVTKGVIDRWAIPGIEYEDIKRRSHKYLKENNVHLLSDEEINDNNRLFKKGCEKLGYRVQQFPINVKGCQGSSVCNLGCPNGAKQGTDQVQLPLAEAGGVEVVTNCEVVSIAERRCRAVVRQTDFGEPSAWEPGEYHLRAKIIVLSAGAVYSPTLMLRAGYGENLPMLGRYLTLHPALILVGEHAEAISNFIGFPKSYYSDEFWQTHGFLLETCMYFPFTTAKNLIGFGSEHSELMRAFPRLQMILVLALDRARRSNRVTIDRDGNPVVDYTLHDDVLDSLHESMKASARVFFAAGARRVHAPAGSSFFINASDADRVNELIPRSRVKPGKISVTSAHIMGGCRMGTNSGDSVTDSRGRVHGMPWLRIADASLFPRCSEVNPYVTVMALADRVAEGILGDAGELREPLSQARHQNRSLT